MFFFGGIEEQKRPSGLPPHFVFGWLVVDQLCYVFVILRCSLSINLLEGVDGGGVLCCDFVDLLETFILLKFVLESVGCMRSDLVGGPGWCSGDVLLLLFVPGDPPFFVSLLWLYPCRGGRFSCKQEAFKRRRMHQTINITIIQPSNLFNCNARLKQEIPTAYTSSSQAAEVTISRCQEERAFRPT